jgi:hypothetical protein
LSRNSIGFKTANEIIEYIREVFSDVDKELNLKEIDLRYGNVSVKL